MADITTSLWTSLALQETSGTTAADASGNGRTGTYARDASNTTTTGPGGLYPLAYNANGTSDWIDHTQLQIVNGAAGTWCGWFKTSTTGRWLFGWESANFTGAQINSTTITVGRNSGSGNLTASLANGAWHHLAIIYSTDYTTISGYADGVSIGSVTVTSSDAHLGAIGKRAAGSFFAGQVAGVKIYSRALAADDVWQLYLQGFPPKISTHGPLLFNG